MNNTEVERLEMDWVISLENRLSDTNLWDRKRGATIYRVPDIMKKVDPQAYEPSLVSLGPYHHDKPHLQAMNQLKWKYLKAVLHLNCDMVLKDYLDLIKGLETQARGAYSEEVNMSSNSFVEMMLLDGCFVMLTITGWIDPMEISEESTLWTRFNALQDIFILENQLPFFLLETLFLSAFPQYDRDFFRSLTFMFIRKYFFSNIEFTSDNETIHHIIHLFLSCIDPTTNNGNDNGKGNDNQSSTFGFLCNSKLVETVCVSLPSKLRSSLLSQVNKKRTGRDANPEEDLPVPDLPWIPNATVCNEARIHFKRKQKAKSFLDITFHKGKLEIPQIHIYYPTNSLLRNLIAYEQCSTDSKFRVTSYAVFMDYLIDTAADVELLQQHEIIISDLGDSQEIATLFSKLNTNLCYNSEDFYIADVIFAMKKHHDTRCNKWRARLNRDYFSSPWAAISLFGVLALFVLTVIQTTYTVLSYYPSH
ncbi:UPF0481 protein At3g47200-like [Zingiber officinale]|uniref:Uncharacterized protein n=1 Tax=Zingiber officinale TaxID=94328 RepID=A0A8J5LFE3_ZINOF|nr:UPF0481 protein At3g47200-like [Zingiber officinale]KAG6512622.1 hypothetical protein ZIOFF_030747 [Zingiber officinale]